MPSARGIRRTGGPVIGTPAAKAAGRTCRPKPADAPHPPQYPSPVLTPRTLCGISKEINPTSCLRQGNVFSYAVRVARSFCKDRKVLCENQGAAASPRLENGKNAVPTRSDPDSTPIRTDRVRTPVTTKHAAANASGRHAKTLDSPPNVPARTPRIPIRKAQLGPAFPTPRRSLCNYRAEAFSKRQP